MKVHKCTNDFLTCFFSDRSTTKPKTFDPCWNESFIHEVTNAKNIGLTVFHDAAIPPDDFVANCTIPFEDLAHRDKEQQDFWVRFPCIYLHSSIFSSDFDIACHNIQPIYINFESVVLS